MLLFSHLDETLQRPDIDKADMARYGFLPSGVYERVLSKLASSVFHAGVWRPQLSKAASVLYLGGQRVRVTHMEALRCLAVDVGNGNPIAIHARVTEALKHELGEVMRSVHVTTWLEAGSDCARYLSLEAVREALDERRDFISHDSTLIMTNDALENQCGMWAIDRAFREAYDAFLSYRWDTPPEFTVDAQFADAPLTQAIFDQLTSHNVTPEHRPIVVFKDTVRMRNGVDFLDRKGMTALSDPSGSPIL
jgi:hypothetical protein